MNGLQTGFPSNRTLKYKIITICITWHVAVVEPAVGVAGTELGSEHLGIVVDAEQSPLTPHLHVWLVQTELVDVLQTAFEEVQTHVLPPAPSAAWQ